jgi:hypothetical protein
MECHAEFISASKQTNSFETLKRVQGNRNILFKVSNFEGLLLYKYPLVRFLPQKAVKIFRCPKRNSLLKVPGRITSKTLPSVCLITRS